VENKAKTTKAARTATGLQLDTMCAIPSSSSSSLVTVLSPLFLFHNAVGVQKEHNQLRIRRRGKKRKG
jgi:hypothetical protein